MHALDKILDRWREEAASTPYDKSRDKGTAFERLCKVFLTHDPVQQAQFQNVQFYADWAGDRASSKSDLGIDLVAELVDEPGYYAAIQCKFRKTDGTIPKSEINSFLAESGRTEFRRRVWIDTTGREWSANAEQTLRKQEKPVQRIGLHDLKDSPIEWAAYVKSEEVGERKPPSTPRPHQKDAIKSAVDHLGIPGTRGKLFMACGTGKTLVGLEVAKNLAGKGGRVLVLVPSLALLSQTLRAWLDDSKPDTIRAFAVCSDSQTGRPRKSAGDTADMDVLDLALPATTDAAKLAEKATPSAADKMTVVFATYQSSGIVGEAQLKHGLPRFDLAIADEAHRTAGALIPGEDLSPFVRIHDDDALLSDRRLYMTATPKVYAPSARTRAGDLAATLCSMDDVDRYGPVLHETRFGDAVDRNLLSDYKVIVLTVPESLAAKIRIKKFEEGKELTLGEQGRMIGCLRALAKTDTDEFPEDDRVPMRRAIAFCNLVESSKQLEASIHEVAEAYAEEYGNGEAPTVSARHVDGTFNAAKRGDALAFLEETPVGETRILTNARCLTEGVDVPALDAVLFMHPRKSQIEVVQAVGRVMRKAPGKKLGYVILPVVVPSAASPEQALADDKRWQAVWQTLNAIRSHDERFEGMLNRIEMGEVGDRISIIALADWQPPSTVTPPIDPPPPTPPITIGEFDFEGLPEAIRTRIVEKCGNRRYWEEWADDVAQIASAHIERIKALIEAGDAEREIFVEFLTELQDDLNPEVSEGDAIEMLAQHMVTEPVFEALFGDTDQARRNAVSQGMQKVLKVLKSAEIDAEAASLDDFYASVRARVKGAASTEARQRIIVELYDRFFRKAFPKVMDRLGIVYTPVEIVDFILHSVQEVLAREFKGALGDSGVHILDPFTGTGTFITRLMQSGLLSPEQILRKYGSDGELPELHANEMVLLAYYIASVNIETAFQGATGSDYRQFEGICLTDTFALNDSDELLEVLFPINSERRTRQRELDIRVIVGNPPWSAGQKSVADKNPNANYPGLEERVSKTYASKSRATLKRYLYNSYRMALRWATDRLGDDGGVVAFVTSGAWIDGVADSGVRACIAEEFSSVYVLNLRGNTRTKGEIARKEGGQTFGSGSRETVAISVFVCNPNASHSGCQIWYRDIGDYLSRERKLEMLREWGSISSIDDWEQITPDRHNDWIDQRDETFQSLYPIVTKQSKADNQEEAIFGLSGPGYLSGRDAYVYSFSAGTCAENARKMVQNYNAAMCDWSGGGGGGESGDLHDIVDRHASHTHWNAELIRHLRNKVSASFDERNIRRVGYRPFVQQHLYGDYTFATRPGRMRDQFPGEGSENRAICVSGVGFSGIFSVLVFDAMPDLNSVGVTQCFPRYRYVQEEANQLLDETGGARRVDNISDFALASFRTHYDDDGISKDDIFDYIYGVLHAQDYREQYAADLSKSLPRIPFAPDFNAFAEAGRALADLHIGYETGPEYPLVPEISESSERRASRIFGSRAMRMAKDDDSVLIVNDRLRITGIPDEAHRYEVNGRTPIQWFIDRYRVTTDKRSGIVNDPNAWFADEEAFISAVCRIVHLSVETVRIVDGLPGALAD